MKEFTLSCIAATPAKGCKGVKRFVTSEEEKERLVAKHVERGGVCSVCFNAGCAPRASQRTSRTISQIREADPEELVTVTCWNNKCQHGTQEVSERRDKEGNVLREAFTRPAKAKFSVKRKDAARALCRGCRAEAKKAAK